MNTDKIIVIKTGADATPMSEIMDAVESMKQDDPIVFEITPILLPPPIKCVGYVDSSKKNRRRGNKFINHYS